MIRIWRHGSVGRAKQAYFATKEKVKIISGLVAKLTGNNSLIESFKKDPAKAVKDLLGGVSGVAGVAGAFRGCEEKD